MEPRIVEEHAHQVIETLPYSQSTVLTRFAFRVVFGCCGMKTSLLWRFSQPVNIVSRGVQQNCRPDPPGQTDRTQTGNRPTRLPGDRWWVLAIPN